MECTKDSHLLLKAISQLLVIPGTKLPEVEKLYSKV